MSSRKLRMGMVGGGGVSLIGATHRRAALLDGGVELVAGAFAPDRDEGLASGRAMFVPDHRNYADWAEMAEREAALPARERIDFVSIVTPNALHFPVALEFCRRGFHVMCEKPMTLDAIEAQALGEAVRKSGVVFALMHGYSGYPMVKQARECVRSGALGKVHRVTVNYSHGNMLALSPQEIAGRWRTDPASSGRSNAVADIGTHGFHLISYVTGLSLARLCADLHRAPGHVLENEATILAEFDNGAKGVIQVSQLCAGDQNNLWIRVHGDEGALEWQQTAPEQLWLRRQGEPVKLLRKGDPGLCQAAKQASRLPAGHPEGFIEAFANIYASFFGTVRAGLDARPPTEFELDFPGIRDGEIGMAFVEAVLDSDAATTKWSAFGRQRQT